MAVSYATVHFEAESHEDAERIVAGWSLPGASMVEVLFTVEAPPVSMNVAEPTPQSPIDVDVRGEPLVGAEKPA